MADVWHVLDSQVGGPDDRDTMYSIVYARNANAARRFYGRLSKRLREHFENTRFKGFYDIENIAMACHPADMGVMHSSQTSKAEALNGAAKRLGLRKLPVVAYFSAHRQWVEQRLLNTFVATSVRVVDHDDRYAPAWYSSRGLSAARKIRDNSEVKQIRHSEGFAIVEETRAGVTVTYKVDIEPYEDCTNGFPRGADNPTGATTFSGARPGAPPPPPPVSQGRLPHEVITRHLDVTPADPLARRWACMSGPADDDASVQFLCRLCRPLPMQSCVTRTWDELRPRDEPGCISRGLACDW